MINQDKTNQEVLHAFQKGKLEKALFLIRLELESNPHSVSTWAWAYRLAETTAEERYYLDKILALDPENEFAQQKMAELASRPGRDSTNSPNQAHPSQQPQKKFNLIGLIFLPLERLFQEALPAAITLYFASTTFAGYAFYRFNTSFFGLSRSNISCMALSPDREIIEADDLSWQRMQITGQDIFEIKAYDQEGKFLTTWQDIGCNSILVQSVEILEN